MLITSRPAPTVWGVAIPAQAPVNYMAVDTVIPSLVFAAVAGAPIQVRSVLHRVTEAVAARRALIRLAMNYLPHSSSIKEPT